MPRGSLSVRLRSDWRVILRKAWSVRLMLLSAALNGLAAVWFVLSDNVPEWLFLVGGVLLPVAALVASLIDQPKMRHDDE